MEKPSLRWLVGRAWDARVWRPAHARLLWFQVAGRNRSRAAGITDDDHLLTAARWLARAQDASGDGGAVHHAVRQAAAAPEAAARGRHPVLSHASGLGACVGDRVERWWPGGARTQFFPAAHSSLRRRGRSRSGPADSAEMRGNPCSFSMS